MNAGAPLTRRTVLSRSLGIGEALFASSDERRFAAEIEAGLEQVEAGLLQVTAFADEIADVTSRYLLEAGGKRVRPVLTLLTAQLGQGSTPEVIQAAQAIEITHLASLYHDDVMDEAQLRRGVPSAQAVWGNSVAILTGDLLFARASRLIAELGDRALKLQSDTFERLCLGQLHETLGPGPDDDPIEHYLQVLRDKTGSLISTAAEVGVIFSNADPAYVEAVRVFGEKIGIAFQLVDDIIDLSSEVESTGKQAGTDLRGGVATLPLLYLRRAAVTDPGAAELLERLERGLAAADVVADAGSAADPAAEAQLLAAIEELRSHPVTDQTLADARRWAQEAVDALEPLPEGPVRKALTRFAQTIVERSN